MSWSLQLGFTSSPEPISAVPLPSSTIEPIPTSPSLLSRFPPGRSQLSKVDSTSSSSPPLNASPLDFYDSSSFTRSASLRSSHTSSSTYFAQWGSSTSNVDSVHQDCSNHNSTCRHHVCASFSHDNSSCKGLDRASRKRAVSNASSIRSDNSLLSASTSRNPALNSHMERSASLGLPPMVESRDRRRLASAPSLLPSASAYAASFATYAFPLPPQTSALPSSPCAPLYHPPSSVSLTPSSPLSLYSTRNYRPHPPTTTSKTQPHSTPMPLLTPPMSNKSSISMRRPSKSSRPLSDISSLDGLEILADQQPTDEGSGGELSKQNLDCLDPLLSVRLGIYCILGSHIVSLLLGRFSRVLLSMSHMVTILTPLFFFFSPFRSLSASSHSIRRCLLCESNPTNASCDSSPSIYTSLYPFYFLLLQFDHDNNHRLLPFLLSLLWHVRYFPARHPQEPTSLK